MTIKTIIETFKNCLMWLLIPALLLVMKLVMTSNKEVDEEMRSEIEQAKKEEPFIIRYRRWKEADEIIKNIPAEDFQC